MEQYETPQIVPVVDDSEEIMLGCSCGCSGGGGAGAGAQ